jgi:hypothetical protein
MKSLLVFRERPTQWMKNKRNKARNVRHACLDWGYAAALPGLDLVPLEAMYKLAVKVEFTVGDVQNSANLSDFRWEQRTALRSWR